MDGGRPPPVLRPWLSVLAKSTKRIGCSHVRGVVIHSPEMVSTRLVLVGNLESDEHSSQVA
jgi:hypothetical protein